MGAETRGRLVATAGDLMQASSFAQVGVGDVCRAAGVNKGSLYHFFDSKEDLAAAVLDAHWARMTGLMEVTVGGEGEPLDRIDAFVAAFIDTLDQRRRELGTTPGCPIGSFAAEFAGSHPSLGPRTTHMLGQWVTVFERALDEARALGHVDADLDPAVAARSLVGYVQGMALMAQAMDDPGVARSMAVGVRPLLQATT
ncbi:MAG TPA: TetR/AcrR family transcriptional regulator [Nitriliruptoraceae bacterium]|nr:TetR/AcrR family transcriptional regulator [Nitriliruptoraceae bacterium]